LRERIKPRFDKFKNRVNTFLDEHPDIKEKLKNLKQKLIEIRLRIYSRLEKIHDTLHDIVERICERIHNSKIRQIIRNIRKHIREEHAEELAYVRERVTALVHKLEARADELYLGPLRGIIKLILHRIENRLENGYYDESNLVKSFIHDSRHLVEEVVDHVFLFDADSAGVLRLPALLPVPSVAGIARRIHENLLSRFRDRQYNRPFTNPPSLLDRYFRVKSALLKPKDILPPFKAAGLIVDSQYFITFDGRVLDLDGHCSYLLAADFLDRNFTVAVKFTDGKKTIILSDHQDSVEIGPESATNHQVVLNGKSVTSPADAERIHVSNFEYGVAAQSSTGVKVTSGISDKADICVVSVNGFYHGRSLGLLGSNNLEHMMISFNLTATELHLPLSLHLVGS